MLQLLKKGGIHIKEKNKGSFRRWCGGNVTEECIRRGKASSNPKIRKKATFASNARRWKHLHGGVVKAGDKAKSNLTKRKNPDWDNLDRGYRYLTSDMKLPHDLAIALMGNVVEESQGNYQAVLRGGPGRGLIQWEKSAPSGRYSLWGKILTSVTKPANVYDPKTDTVKNYWASWNGLKGELVRQRFKTAPLKEKTRIYAESYLRPGKPRIKDRQLSAMQLDSIYNPRIKNIIVKKFGGLIKKAQEGTKFDWGLLAVNTGTSLLSTISENTKASAEAQKLIALNNLDFNLTLNTISELNSLKALNNYLKWLSDYKSGATLDLPSSIVTNHLGYMNFASDYSKALEDLKNKNKIAESKLNSKKAENWGNAASGIALSIFSSGILNLLGNKQKLNSTLNYNFLNNVNTAFKNFGTRNSDGTMNLGNGMGSVNLRTGLYNVQPLSLPYENNL